MFITYAFIIFNNFQKGTKAIWKYSSPRAHNSKQFYEQFNLHYKNSKYKSHNHGNAEFQPCKHKYDKSYYW